MRGRLEKSYEKYELTVCGAQKKKNPALSNEGQDGVLSFIYDLSPYRGLGGKPPSRFGQPPEQGLGQPSQLICKRRKPRRHRRASDF